MRNRHLYLLFVILLVSLLLPPVCESARRGASGSAGPKQPNIFQRLFQRARFWIRSFSSTQRELNGLLGSKGGPVNNEILNFLRAAKIKRAVVIPPPGNYELGYRMVEQLKAKNFFKDVFSLEKFQSGYGKEEFLQRLKKEFSPKTKTLVISDDVTELMIAFEEKYFVALGKIDPQTEELRKSN